MISLPEHFKRDPVDRLLQQERPALALDSVMPDPAGDGLGWVTVARGVAQLIKRNQQIVQVTPIRHEPANPA